MTKKFLIRKFKLLFHKSKKKDFSHLAVFLLTVLIGLNLSSPSKIPVTRQSVLGQSSKFLKASPPVVSAKSVFILDITSGEVVYQKQADSEVYPASTTKMMTAVIAKETFDPNQVLTISRLYNLGSQDLKLPVGGKITIEKLLYALLVSSSNDAAEILAENYPGGRTAFVEAMNRKASELLLHHTHFENPTGLDQINHYSSAADLARLAKHLISVPELARIVGTQTAVLSTVDFSGVYTVTNVNQLLGKVPGVMGVKTGFTDLAGQVLVTYVNRENRPLIISVLGSLDRFSDTESLITWAYSQ